MEYLLQIQIADMVEIWIFVEGKREGDNPCDYLLLDIHFCVYVSPDSLIYLWPLGF